jgi:hypothetical protein
MLELTAISVVILLYVIPLNIFVYYLSEQTVRGIVQSQSSIVEWFRFQNHFGVVSALFYIFYVLLFSIAVYAIIKYVVARNIYTLSHSESNKELFLLKYTNGQKSMNNLASILIILTLVMHILFWILDIKLFVLAFLCLGFIFKSIKLKLPLLKR